MIALILLLHLVALSSVGTARAEPQEVSSNYTYYAYDVSFPMLSESVSTNYPWLPHNVDPENNPTPEEYKNMPIQALGNRQKFYEDYMQGCRDYWEKDGQSGSCDDYENERLQNNIEQPPSMVNYTDIGYKKIRAPKDVFKLLLEFYEKNMHNEQDENFGTGNIFINYWNTPTKMIDVSSELFEGGGSGLEDALWDSSEETISEWTGQRLVASSIYGIRVYKEGAVLCPHVDRLPLISSAIINVAQDVDEPWPLEVVGHDGVARNVTMEPGDMVLYESHSVVHGRPFPLKGRFLANLFIHFDGYMKRCNSSNYPRTTQEPHPEYTDNYDSDLPPYILEGSIVAKQFRDGEYEGKVPSQRVRELLEEEDDEGASESHGAAGDGDLDALIEIAKDDMESLFNEDNNGWQPIHEAARSGHFEVVEFLTSQGADVNARTGDGHSVLQIVRDYFGQEHDLYEFLSDLGALEMGPDL